MFIPISGNDPIWIICFKWVHLPPTRNTWLEDEMFFRNDPFHSFSRGKLSFNIAFNIPATEVMGFWYRQALQRWPLEPMKVQRSWVWMPTSILYPWQCSRHSGGKLGKLLKQTEHLPGWAHLRRNHLSPKCLRWCLFLERIYYVQICTSDVFLPVRYAPAMFCRNQSMVTSGLV